MKCRNSRLDSSSDVIYSKHRCLHPRVTDKIYENSFLHYFDGQLLIFQEGNLKYYHQLDYPLMRERNEFIKNRFYIIIITKSFEISSKLTSNRSNVSYYKVDKLKKLIKKRSLSRKIVFPRLVREESLNAYTTPS